MNWRKRKKLTRLAKKHNLKYPHEYGKFVKAKATGNEHLYHIDRMNSIAYRFNKFFCNSISQMQKEFKSDIGSFYRYLIKNSNTLSLIADDCTAFNTVWEDWKNGRCGKNKI